MQVYPFGSANHNDSSMHSNHSEKEDAQSSLNYSLKQGYSSYTVLSVYFSILPIAL